MDQTEKNVNDEFMLQEYASIAAAHFDSQAGLRMQFRFYMVIAAVPLTVLGFALNHPSTVGVITTVPVGLWNLPPLASAVFIGIGVLGFLMSIAMIHSAFDCVLYARTVNGVRAYFTDRAKRLHVDLRSYLLMPLQKSKPKYFHLRAFFWQHTLIGLVNAAYISIGIQNSFQRPCWSTMTFVLIALGQALSYPLLGWSREKKPIAD